MSLTGIKSIITHLEYVKDVNVITKENMVLLLQEKSENRAQIIEFERSKI